MRMRAREGGMMVWPPLARRLSKMGPSDGFLKVWVMTNPGVTAKELARLIHSKLEKWVRK